MTRQHEVPIWKAIPFIRLLLPFAAGIIIQWYTGLAIASIISGIVCFCIAYSLFTFLPFAVQFKWQYLRGFQLQCLLFFTGMLATWLKDGRHQPDWYGKLYQNGQFISAIINEPLVEKNKSYKAEALVTGVTASNSSTTCQGKIILYFSKTAEHSQLQYGDKIIIRKNLSPIKNSGNPGAFNYQQYAAFQQIYHTAYLKPGDWAKTGKNEANAFKQILFCTKQKILTTLRAGISSKQELGIAEALLIGYTNDLDKDLVQAYSNTGVVHIIAISGMHLGLIYTLLLLLFGKLPIIKKSKPAQAILILSCLWLFSLLTGGSASVIRSAVMFSGITIGKMFFKPSSIYNSLAASAFVMLCYNPFYLWDVGFQLSYLAVVGIVIFQKPLYNLLYVTNKWLDKLWQATALTTAAQILTFPVCIYYFHQFPVLFLFTNLVAVPLSTGILYAAILSVMLCWFPSAGLWVGKIAGAGVWLMNQFILFTNQLPFALWDKIPATVFTTWLLYGVVCCTAAWLLTKNKKILYPAISLLTIFLLVQAIVNWQGKTQQKIIVYNVNGMQAIDFIRGNNYYFTGDSALLEEGVLQNFHLKPARVAQQLYHRSDTLPGLYANNIFFQFNHKKMAVINQAIPPQNADQTISLNFIVLAKNAAVDIKQLATIFHCPLFIFDGSNSMWTIEKWKQECIKLHLLYHSVPESGAFVTSL